MEKFYLLFLFLIIPLVLIAQPKALVEDWTGKTILLVGAHPDNAGAKQ